jgi:hypothetical protein
MSLGKKIKDALKGLEDKSILTDVEAIADKAEAKDKVQKANDDLVTQRTEWQEKEKVYKSKSAENETAIKDKDKKIKTLEDSTLSPEELQKLKIVEKTQADFNKVLEEVKTLTETVASEKAQRVEAEELSKKSSKDAKVQAQKTSISNELAKHGIIEERNVSAGLKIFAEKSAVLETDESGNYVEKYYTKNDKHENVTSDLSSMVKNFAEKKEHLFFISSSGNAGPGQNHDNRNVPPRRDNFETAQAAKSAELNDWERDFKPK